MNFLGWVLFGLITRFIVHLIDPGNVKEGLLKTLVLGILGIGVTGFNLTSFIIAVAGSLMLVFMQRTTSLTNQCF